MPERGTGTADIPRNRFPFACRLVEPALGAVLLTVSLGAVGQDVHRIQPQPHASASFTRFTHSTRAYSVEYPVDWEAHEQNRRTNIGPEDGLVPTGRGYRTVYGVILSIVDDPARDDPQRTLEGSTKLIVDGVLKRNRHQNLSGPVQAAGELSGAPAYSALLLGTSPVTGSGERVEILCRRFGGSQILYLILVSPADAYAVLKEPLQRIRNSLRVPAE